MLTTPLINECFRVGVTSVPRMARAGVEPRMGSPTEKHQFRSTAGTLFSSKIATKSIRDYLRMPHRASAVLPSTRHPGVNSGAAPSMAALATAPVRYSLIIDVVFDSVA